MHTPSDERILRHPLARFAGPSPPVGAGLVRSMTVHSGSVTTVAHWAEVRPGVVGVWLTHVVESSEQPVCKRRNAPPPARHPQRRKLRRLGVVARIVR